MSLSLIPPRLTFVAEVRVTVSPALTIGANGAGVRDVIPITGGTIRGPLLSAEGLPGGADWSLLRPSGIAEVWARYTVRTDDGSLIMVTNAGLASADEIGNWQGTTAPSFEVATNSPHAWLAGSTFVGSLDASASGDLVVMQWWRLVR